MNDTYGQEKQLANIVVGSMTPPLPAVVMAVDDGNGYVVAEKRGKSTSNCLITYCFLRLLKKTR